MSTLVTNRVSFAAKALAVALFLAPFGFAAAQQLAANTEPTQPPPPPVSPITLKGDPEQGQTLATTCSGCHGVPGYQNVYPTYNVPKLGGQNGAYITVALQDYRRGSRSHPTMRAQASVLSDQDIADIAAYFSSVKGKPSTGMSDGTPAQIQAGKEKSAACAACHGEAGISKGPQWPNLAGQHASYLRQALQEYKAGGRRDVIMGPMATTLDDDAIEAIAAYFAAQPGLFTTPGL
ncbi:MAG TPA: cytochrome c [Gammaproteobacteria bacterium]|nr:cytochrome c [Gammaproteobacteria bacterium]